MKKQLLTMLLTLTVIILSSCNSASNSSPTESKSENATDDIPASEIDSTEVSYFTTEGLYRTYFNARDLAEDSGFVAIGQIKDISFEVLDLATGLPPTEKTSEYNRTLYTIYSIDIITPYKGEFSDNFQFAVNGGIKDYRVEEQLALGKKMNVWHSEGITLHDDKMPEIKIGETYLFLLDDPALRGFKDLLPGIMNPRQSFYTLSNPLKKYGESIPEDDIEYITVKDIISTFGDDKWDVFWKEWQKDNPNWESRLAEMEAEVDVPKQEERVYEEQSGEGEILFAETEPQTYE